MTTKYTNLSLKELEDQYKAALESNASPSVLQEYVDEFITRNIDEPYIGQTGANPPPEPTAAELLRFEVERLQLQIGASRSDSGLILPPSGE